MDLKAGVVSISSSSSGVCGRGAPISSFVGAPHKQRRMIEVNGANGSTEPAKLSQYLRWPVGG